MRGLTIRKSVIGALGANLFGGALALVLGAGSAAPGAPVGGTTASEMVYPSPVHLTSPVSGMALAPDGAGYWLVGSDGGVMTYGDAGFAGSAGGMHLSAPVVAMAAAPDGAGYWLVGSDGGVMTYGDAGFAGS